MLIVGIVEVYKLEHEWTSIDNIDLAFFKVYLEKHHYDMVYTIAQKISKPSTPTSQQPSIQQSHPHIAPGPVTTSYSY